MMMLQEEGGLRWKTVAGWLCSASEDTSYCSVGGASAIVGALDGFGTLIGEGCAGMPMLDAESVGNTVERTVFDPEGVL